MLSSKLTLFFASILVIYPAWFCNSSLLRINTPIVFLSWLILILLLFAPALDRKEQGAFATIRSRFGFILRDPLFYIGALFVGYSLVQFLNTGAVRISKATAQTPLTIIPSRFPSLPFSIDEQESLQLLIWAMAVWVLVLAIRHAITAKDRDYFVGVVLLNAFVLGVVGIVQYFSATDKLLWLFDTKGDFVFSTFGYENFGGSFFTLCFAVTCGFFLSKLMALIKGGNKSDLLKLLLSFLAMPVFAFSIFLTNTRFCYLELFVLLMVFGVMVFILFVRRVGGKQGFISLIVVVPLVSVVIWTAFNSNSYVSRDLRAITDNPTKFVKREFSVRTWQWQAAVKLWRDYPVLGTGHDSLRYVQTLYLPKDQHAMASTAGKANTHNDFLQYLSELGIVGMSILMVFVAVLILNAIARQFWRNPLFLWFVFGIGANIAHSLVDLPYRNCLNVFTTFSLLAIMSSGKISVSPKAEPAKVSILFKVFSLVLLMALLLQLGMVVLSPMRYKKAQELLASSEQVDSFAEKAKLLSRAESYYPRLPQVREPLALALLEQAKANDDMLLYKQAAFYLQQLQGEDDLSLDLSLALSDAMEKSGYRWEAFNVLYPLFEENPEDETVFNALKFFYLRQGYQRKALELMKSRKNLKK